MYLDYASQKKRNNLPQKDNKTIEIINKSEDISSRWISEEFRPKNQNEEKKKDQQNQSSKTLFY